MKTITFICRNQRFKQVRKNTLVFLLLLVFQILFIKTGVSQPDKRIDGYYTLKALTDKQDISAEVILGAVVINDMFSSFKRSTNFRNELSAYSNFTFTSTDPEKLIKEFKNKMAEIEVTSQQRKIESEAQAKRDIAALELDFKNLLAKFDKQYDTSSPFAMAMRDAAIETAKQKHRIKIAAAKREAEEELDNALRTGMESIKNTIIKENTLKMAESLNAASIVKEENKEKRFISDYYFHKCVIREVNSNYDYKKSSWINPNCPSTNASYYKSMGKGKTDYISVAFRKYKLYKEELKDSKFLEMTKKYLNAGLAENKDNARAYLLKSQLESDIFEKYFYAKVAKLLAPSDNLIISYEETIRSKFTDKLFKAIKNNDQYFVNKAIDKKFHLGLSKGGKTPLVESINCDNANAFESILKAKEDFETDIKKNGNLYLNHSIAQKSRKCIDKLLKFGVDINYIDNQHNGLTALNISLDNYSDRIFQQLIDNGADISKAFSYAKNNARHQQVNDLCKFIIDKDFSNIDGMKTALSQKPKLFNEIYKNNKTYTEYAIDNDYVEIFSLYKDRGFDINSQIGNKLVVEYAVEKNASKIIDFLIKMKVDCKKEASSGGNLINACIQYKRNSLINKFVPLGISINELNKTGIYPIEQSIINNDIELFRKLLNFKAVLTNPVKSGGNLLNLAIEKDRKSEFIDSLLVRKVSPSIKGSVFYPIEYAIQRNDLNLFEKLLSFNVDIMMKHEAGGNLINYAIDEKTDIRILQKLLENKISPNEYNDKHIKPLVQALKTYNEVVELLCNTNADYTIVPESGGNILHYIILYKSNVNLVQFFSSKGIDINKVDNNNFTPLIFALNKKQTNYALELLNNKANPNLPDGDGNSPIHYACENNDLEAVKKLVEVFADKNVKNPSGNTPLHITVKNEYYSIAHFLLKSGVLTEIQNNDLQTPLMLAKSKKYKIMTKLIKKGGDYDYKAALNK